MTGAKVCWITGASSGIGASVAEYLAADGHTVVLSARGEERLLAQVARISQRGGDAHAVIVDVADADEVRSALAEIEATRGGVDVLIANAGLNVGRRAWGEVETEDFHRLIDVNLNGVYHCIDAVLPGMRARGAGQIVNIASWAGKFFSAKPGPAYTAAKAAVVALTASLNMSEFVHGVRACALCPGEVCTPAMARRIPPVLPEVLATMLQPEDIAEAVRLIVRLPPRVCVNELIISPTWNAAFGAPLPKPSN